MAQWGGVAMLVITGIVIFAGWALLWLSPTRFLRKLVLERLYPWAKSPVMPGLQAIIWPIAPLVAFLWIGVGAMAAREIIGRDNSPETTLVVALFVVIAGVAIWRALGHELPLWAYPGWMAERYYYRHPDRAKADLRA